MSLSKKALGLFRQYLRLAAAHSMSVYDAHFARLHPKGTLSALRASGASRDVFSVTHMSLRKTDIILFRR